MSFTVEITSVSDRDDLVAEIWMDGAMVAELHRDYGKFKIDIYPNESGQSWCFEMSDWLAVLSEAQRKLG
jgi:hypothetical protein